MQSTVIVAQLMRTRLLWNNLQCIEEASPSRCLAEAVIVLIIKHHNSIQYTTPEP